MLSEAANINPLFFIISCALAYLILAFVAQHLLPLAATGLGIVLLSFPALPSGMRTLETARQLPTTSQRIACVLAALPNGAPIESTAAVNAGACHYSGVGVGEPDSEKVDDLLQENRRALTP